MGYTTWEWTRSSCRRRPATAGYWSRRPLAAYPGDCPPGTGCGASCGRNGDVRYALRMETVEPVFGQIKQGRGFRQFLLRGLAKVNREWLLICAGHNLLKLFRFGAGMSGKVRGQRRHWEQPGVVPGHGQRDLRVTTQMCPSAPGKNCCRRVILTD